MHKLSATEFKEMLKEISQMKNPITIMVFGNPGIGKTFSIQTAAQELNRKYIPLSLIRLESYDLKGALHVNEKHNYVEWFPPKFWQEIVDSGGNCIVHFDEFTLADASVQGTILDVILEKRIDELKLPDKTMFVLSGNMGGEDGTDAHSISSALTGGRGLICQMIPPTVEEWIKFQNPVKSIKGFLLANPQQLYVGPDKNDPFAPWTCPRSWSKLDSIIKELNLVNNKDKILFYAKNLLSLSTIASFASYLDDVAVNIFKFLEFKEDEWEKFAVLPPQNQTILLEQCADILKNIENEDEFVQNVEKTLNKLVAYKIKSEAIVAFISALKKYAHLIPLLAKVHIGKKPLGEYLDALLIQRRSK